MMSQDHYDTLGISAGASPREIRLAYLRASVKAHPDRGGSHSEMVAVSISLINVNNHMRLTCYR